MRRRTSQDVLCCTRRMSHCGDEYVNFLVSCACYSFGSYAVVLTHKVQDDLVVSSIIRHAVLADNKQKFCLVHSVHQKVNQMFLTVTSKFVNKFPFNLAHTISNK